MDTFKEALKNLKTREGQLNNVLMQGVLEGFMDGVLILNHQEELVYVSRNAYKIIEQLTHHETQTQLIDQEIKRISQAVKDSCELYPEKPVIIESEMRDKGVDTLRLRARSLQLEADEQPLILIILENQNHSVQSLVITEVQEYGLTPREAEIWLLRRANHSYKEIATELFISLNTVKKHIKNIHDKLRFHQFRQGLSG
ncbi:MAG: LuxR C-terminal-related transcriptional regulator [Cyanobacteria bacterium P01_F01_bin.86]